MARLIDADALDMVLEDFEKRYRLFFGVADGIKTSRTVVSAMRTVEAAPVVHGEWDIIEDDYCGLTALQCSECKQEYWFEDDPPMKIYSFCPNCGARMDGKEG